MSQIEIPYFTVQSLLREFAKALGTKSFAAKEIDNACKSIEINPFKLNELKQSLIHEPLTRYVNIHFADHVLKQINSVITNYLSLVANYPLTGVSEAQAKQTIHRQYLSIAVGNVCYEMFEAMGTSPEKLANSGQTAFEFTFNRFQRYPIWQVYVDSITKEQKDKFRIWSKGECSELPDIAGIAAVGSPVKEEFRWGTFKARMITARIWDYFFYRSGLCDLNFVGTTSFERQQEIVLHFLDVLPKQECQKYKAARPIGHELFDKLALRKPKQEEDQVQSRLLLERLKNELEQSDPLQYASYYYHWMNARYHLFLGDIDTALNCYKSAYDYSIYRAGGDMLSIIKEATIVTSRQAKPDKNLLNKLRSMAAIFNMDFLPINSANQAKKKPELVESWEIDAYAQLFDSYISKESFFPHAPYPKFYGKNYGMWFVNDNKYELDLSVPNKVFSVGEDGSLIKKMPQLVYFAMKGDEKAVIELINAGADVNKVSSSNESALLMAVQAMQVNNIPLGNMSDTMFKIIASKPHSTKTVNLMTTKRKLTALGCAVQTGRLDIVRKVVELGATIDQRHEVGAETPLFTCLGLMSHHKRPDYLINTFDENKYSDLATQVAMIELVGIAPHDKELFSQFMHSQDQDPSYSHINNEIRRYFVKNIIELSDIREFRKIAKYLINQQANPNAKHNTALTGYTPMFMAAELDEAELFNIMVAEAGGDIQDSCIDPKSEQRYSYYQIAMEWNSQRVLNLFKH